MPYFTYDTSVIISLSPNSLRPARNWFLSSVVLLELTASAVDDAQRKFYEQLSKEYQQNESLIVPNDADWILAGKILFWLTQRRRKVEGGRLRRLHAGASQQMAMDALLATSARRYQAAIVTENWRDFKAIQQFCNVKLIRASDFFR